MVTRRKSYCKILSMAPCLLGSQKYLPNIILIPSTITYNRKMNINVICWKHFTTPKNNTITMFINGYKLKKTIWWLKSSVSAVTMLEMSCLHSFKKHGWKFQKLKSLKNIQCPGGVQGQRPCIFKGGSGFIALPPPKKTKTKQNKKTFTIWCAKMGVNSLEISNKGGWEGKLPLKKKRKFYLKKQKKNCLSK